MDIVKVPYYHVHRSDEISDLHEFPYAEFGNSSACLRASSHLKTASQIDW